MGKRTSTSEEIFFSCLSGFNYYAPERQITEKEMKKSQENGTQYMVHVLSDTPVLVRPMTGTIEPAFINKWRLFVEHPVDIRYIIWPIDVIKLSNQLGLVFSRRAYPGMRPIRELLYNSEQLDWRKDDIKKIIENLLTIFIILHDGGYAYHAFDMDKIFYKSATGEVLLDFSLAMSNCPDPLFQDFNVDVSSVKLEFLPPWINLKEEIKMSQMDDCYSLAAVLFRLMVGRMPYQGRLMDGHGDMMDLMRDNDPILHQQMFEYYHKIPVFIFDHEDTKNSLGLYTNEEIYIERWNALPDTVKEMFCYTFSKETLLAERSKKQLYTVHDWIRVLQQENIIPGEDK